jgi:photosystem II stability/assembly factor-like uncharacterized protein
VVLESEQYLDQHKGRLVSSPDLINWTEIDTGADQELEAITYGGGQFVTVGEAGTLVRSTNGTTWTLLPVANSIDYYGLASNGQRLVAAGDDGTIVTSDDGQNWTVRGTPSSRNLHAVGYGNNLFVASGRRGLIMTSPDGAQWTRRESGVTNYLERVAYGADGWLAVGEHGDLSSSVNGLDWTPGTTGDAYADHEGVAYGAGRWVIAGGYFSSGSDNGPFAVSSIYVSSDRLTWSRASFNAGKRLRDVTYADGLFVAVGNDRLIATSPDGWNWSSYFLPRWREEDNFRRVTHAFGRWVIVGNDGRLVSNPDPTDHGGWRDHLSHTSQNLHDIIGTPDGGFVAVGNNGMLLRATEPLPRIARLLPLPGEIEIEFTTGLVTGPIDLQASSDLRTWQTIATNVQSPTRVPATGETFRFFRLIAP